MIEDYKVKVIIPSGRKEMMVNSLPYVLKSKYVDEILLYYNVRNEEDGRFVYNLSSLDSRIVILGNIKHFGQKMGENGCIYSMYKYCCDEDSIYIKIDDDCVWMEDDCIDKLVESRIMYKDYFIIYPLLINNGFGTYLLSKFGRIELNSMFDNMLRMECHRNNGDINGCYYYRWGSVAEYVHNVLVDKIEKNAVTELYLDNHVVTNQRVSINCICFFGKDIKDDVDNIRDDEYYLSYYKGLSCDRNNLMLGDCIMCHFSFGPQHEYLMKSDLLKQYTMLNRNNKVIFDDELIKKLESF